MCETEKPFACTIEGCKMTFTNESHLEVHTTKHTIALNLEETRNLYIADQTPTPTRFIRNCEEVGLFQDLQNVNPFDETFKKAVELSKSGISQVFGECNEDSLHTPHIVLPQNVEANGEVMYTMEDDDDEGVLRICEPNEEQMEEVMPRPQPPKSETVVVETDVGCENLKRREKIQEKLKECLERKQNSDIQISGNQAVLITPFPVEKLQKADSALIVLKQKTNPLVNVPRKRTAKQFVSVETNDEKERQRESNRLAQTRSRERKRRYMIDLQEKMDLLRQENERLIAENIELRNENYKIKAVLSCHKNCEIADTEVRTKLKTLFSGNAKKPIPIKPNRTTKDKQLTPIMPLPPTNYELALKTIEMQQNQPNIKISLLNNPTIPVVIKKL